MNIQNIANAPTAPLTEALIQQRREHNRIATLGRNRIIYDYYRTQALNGGERMTKLLPRPKTKRPRQVFSAALKSVYRISTTIILAIRREISQ